MISSPVTDVTGDCVPYEERRKVRRLNNGKTRASLLGVVGAYLLYTVYELWQDWGNPDTSMTTVARAVFMALFALSGAALLIYAVRVWQKSGREEENAPPKQDEDSLK